MTEGTGLNALQAALAARVEEETTTLRVPKTKVFVKYRAVTQKELTGIKNRFLPPRKGGAQYTEAQVEKAGIKVNRAVLAEACQGVYLDTEAGLKSADPDGEPPAFDARLTELLGIPEQESRSDIVVLLYGKNDFDISAAVNSVLQFSGGAEAEVYEDASGN